jgi:hypothetical protein
MRISGGSVGPQGLALLLVTAAAGVVLAAHGWSGRQSGLTPGALGGSGPSAPAGSSSSSSPASAAGPSSSPTPSTAPSKTAGAGSGSGAAKVGPLLSSQSYAQYSFQVWPGTPNAAAKAAMTGLSISVHRSGSGISVAAGVNGQPRTTAHLYSGGAKVFIVEASMGDDASNSDYNLGDDGLIVTDTHGRILQ